MTHVMAQLENDFAEEIGCKRKDWDSDTIKVFQDRISEMAASNFFGFDINPDLVKATKMNMVMNNDGSGNILQTNSLLPPHEWSDEFKTKLTEALGIMKSDIRNHTTLGYFNVIVTNPPFGSKIPVKDKNVLEQFELAHIWENDKTNNKWTMTERLQSSVPPEILFIERCTQLLVPGGRMGIVLPDAILGSPGLGYIREWLIKIIELLQVLIFTSIHFNRVTEHKPLYCSYRKRQQNKSRQKKQAGQWQITIFLWLWLKRLDTINAEILYSSETLKVTKYLFPIQTVY